eukprot:CCRYP_017383-RA/>CCRYP_017383-RA protein AED:0.16 eAED:0.16 QI:467/1/1/1/1/1/7/462/973
MMGGSCSIPRRPNRGRRSDGVRDGAGRRRQRSRTDTRLRRSGSRLARLCGGDDDDSEEDDGQTGGRGHMKRAARHSVDAEVPNQSISHFYPPQDNYIPNPQTGTRSPKTLVDLCIDSLCRSLPTNFDELPPGLPQELVDRIFASLTSHGALNSTTLRCLRRCELGVLNLANCRGVSDEWFIPLSSTRSLSPVARKGKRDQQQGQRPRSASMPYGKAVPSSPPPRSIRHTSSVPSPECLGATSSMMDVDDDYQDSDSSPQDDREDSMGDPYEEEHSSSSSSASFVSASSTPFNAPSSSSDNNEDIAEERPYSPLLPSVLPPPDFFSMKPRPMWSSYSGNSSGICMAPYPSLIRQPSPLLPYASSLHTQESSEYAEDAGTTLYSDNEDHHHSSITLLDLRGSRITDRGLLRLSHPSPLSSLEIAKLDNCHGIAGRGLIAFAHSNRLHTLSLANCRRLTDEAVVNVSHLGRSLVAVNLGGCRCLTDRSLEGLSGLLQLRKLDISQCDLITDDGLTNLHDLELIEELSLGWCRQISDEGMSVLAEQPNRSHALRVLRLARCPITDNGLEHIGTLLSLEELDLNGCININSSALGDTLAKLVHLTSLDVSYCPGILRSSWQGKINNLKSLELCYSSVRDTHLSRLSSLPMLEELNLDSCPIGDWTIAHLADNNVVPNIMSLDLADTDLSDIGMMKLAQFKSMKKLSLFYCNVSNAGLRHLASMTNLEVLNLDSREIDDNGLKYLRGLPLKSLDIFSGRVTDLGCAYLSRIKTLTSLELCGGGVGDLGCAHLATLSNLTSLNLSQNERITNRGAAALAALTNLKALNLSNTCVTPDALKFFSGLLKLQSLALYGCKDMVDSPRLDSLQSELPSLRCLRLNSAMDDDGVINHSDSDDDTDDIDDENEEGAALIESRQQGLMFPYHQFDSDESSDENIEEFQDAQHDHDEMESSEDDNEVIMDNDSDEEDSVEEDSVEDEV